jgi:hypothetical protein
VATEAAARTVLAREEPVALLIESNHFWREKLHGQVRGGTEIPTRVSQSEKIWDRAPVLVVNQSALALLQDEGE